MCNTSLPAPLALSPAALRSMPACCGSAGHLTATVPGAAPTAVRHRPERHGQVACAQPPLQACGRQRCVECRHNPGCGHGNPLSTGKKLRERGQKRSLAQAIWHCRRLKGPGSLAATGAKPHHICAMPHMCLGEARGSGDRNRHGASECLPAAAGLLRRRQAVGRGSAHARPRSSRRNLFYARAASSRWFAGSTRSRECPHQARGHFTVHLRHGHGHRV